MGHIDKLSKIQARRDIRRTTARVPKVERTDGEDSILIDFCSFASGRLAVHTPYGVAAVVVNRCL